MIHTSLFVYQWRNSRQAHSRIIQIVDVKHNMQKIIDDMKKKIKNMSEFETQQTVARLVN